jgi:hypothetical protein
MPRRRRAQAAIGHIAHARDELYPLFLRTTEHPVTLSSWRDHDCGGYAASLSIGNAATEVRFAHSDVFIQELCESIAALLLTREDPVDVCVRSTHVPLDPGYELGETTPNLEIPDPDLVEVECIDRRYDTTPVPDPVPDPETGIRRWGCGVS